MSFIKRMNQFFWRERGLGMIPNKQDSRDWIYRENSDALDSAGTGVSLEKYAAVVDQGSTSSCVGQAIANAIWIVEQQSGYSYDYPSRSWLYWNSRYRHQGLNVTDEGTFIRECCKALCKVGVPDENLWPFKKSKINKQPEFGIIMNADPRKGGEYRAISGDRILGIKSALAEGKPVVFGTSLSESFMSSNGDHVIEKPSSSESSVGRHAMTIIGFQEYGSSTRFRVLNSWGKNWRDGGKCWFTEDYIMWSRTRDLTVISGWNRIK